MALSSQLAASSLALTQNNNKHMKKFIVCLSAFISASVLNVIAQNSDWKKLFKDPPAQFKPMPFWHMNGKLTNEGIDSQMHDVKYKSNFGGITVLPVSAQPGFGNGKIFPGMEPPYLSEAYFGFYDRILNNAKKLGLKIVWYDDLDFPSGSAGGRMKKLYSGDTRKVLSKTDTIVTGASVLNRAVPAGTLMAAVALNTTTKERVDISKSVSGAQLTWNVPSGDWQVMLFTCDVVNSNMANDIAVDYLDPQAINKYVELNNEQFAKRYKKYFGTIISQIFFDDVGFFTLQSHGERTWTSKFNEKFKALYGKDPALYYPALWMDIGPETSAARVALFNTRAVLLSEGFPKVITEWCNKYGLKSSGHPPGNYEIQPVDMNGDILKFYRYQHIPLMDLIFSYNHGREGFKLISSAATLYDKPVVAAEIYGAIGWFGSEKFNKQTLYRAAMDVFSRGINFLIPHGMWYNPDSNAVRIPPLISAYNPEIGPELAKYNEWAGRSCMMLQGGRTVSDIAVLYPIASLESWFYFNAKSPKGIGDWGKFVAPGTDYLAISDMLTNEVHRDFTFIHPDILSSGKCVLNKGELILNNKVNNQSYKVLILPGGKTISVKALEKIKAFYDNGGVVIATSILPSESAEFGENEKITALVKTLFNVDPRNAMPENISEINTNAKGGKLVYIPKPSSAILAETLEKMGMMADVSFENNPQPNSGKGMLSYLHKKRDGNDIYFFANSSDDAISTYAVVRGKIKPWLWNPYDGSSSAITEVEYLSKGNEVYTRFPLKLTAINSVFVVGL
ncbi:MAG: hypothetical protein JWM28_3358 [Chitinophagaceae bacterium]|nr:hypothetical protein [Chitinophagaceae bacterium]